MPPQSELIHHFGQHSIPALRRPISPLDYKLKGQPAVYNLVDSLGSPQTYPSPANRAEARCGERERFWVGDAVPNRYCKRQRRP
ncbi:uncharacterized protein EHS24_002044 [Apiotrichum porosum]|uniref:Uncharacterized protein n=1 Tax=Apiotrichum porosum TaxID=105984 RepID=A0A427XHF4_9TREE|nr:uncharacterized protein EHS24_002044 [Apiotrichum porosum]RSH78325.1 hypothetical protein EHS24_002044 [Apiotrichum porosum]